MNEFTGNGPFEQMRLLVRGNETKGASMILEFELVYLQGNSPCDFAIEDNPYTRLCTPPRHYHVSFSEHFSILRGEMGYELNGLVKTAYAGETVHVPVGAIHTFWMDSAETLLVHIDRRPAGRVEEAFAENLAGICRDHLLQSGGTVSPLVKYLQFQILQGKTDNWPVWLPSSMIPVYKRYIQLLSLVTGIPGMYEEYTSRRNLML